MVSLRSFLDLKNVGATSLTPYTHTANMPPKHGNKSGKRKTDPTSPRVKIWNYVCSESVIPFVITKAVINFIITAATKEKSDKTQPCETFNASSECEIWKQCKTGCFRAGSQTRRRRRLVFELIGWLYRSK